MGEDLALPDREAIRTPMQWDDGPNAGFSTAPRERAGPAGADARTRTAPKQVNVRGPAPRPELVAALVREPRSTRCASARRSASAAARSSTCRCPARCWPTASTRPTGSILLLHNLADDAVTVDIGPLDGMDGRPYDLLVDGPYDAPDRRADRARAARLGLSLDPAAPRQRLIGLQ